MRSIDGRRRGLVGASCENARTSESRRGQDEGRCLAGDVKMMKTRIWAST